MASSNFVSSPPPPPNRWISAYNANEARSVFTDKFAQSAPVKQIPVPGHPTPGQNHEIFATRTFPVCGPVNENSNTDLPSKDEDLKVYAEELEKATPAGASPQGTTCRVVDFPPGMEVPMHSTQTIDYGVVVRGAVEWILSSGERRVLREGDVAIQRATPHAWKNVTAMEENGGWLRVFFVMLPIAK